jgi:hypothetical protein
MHFVGDQLGVATIVFDDQDPRDRLPYRPMVKPRNRDVFLTPAAVFRRNANESVLGCCETSKWMMAD